MWSLNNINIWDGSCGLRPSTDWIPLEVGEFHYDTRITINNASNHAIYKI
jgi:hypothetical protein